MSDLLDRFKIFYADSASLDLHRVGEIYHEQMRFKDPFVELRSRAALQEHLEHQYRGVEYCRFEYLDELEARDSAFIKWDMVLKHPKLSRRELSVRGASHIHFDDHIYYHEDIFDVGSMVYHHIPVLGRLTKLINKRLSS